MDEKEKLNGRAAGQGIPGMVCMVVLILSCQLLLAGNHHWPLDAADSSKLSVHGDLVAAAGVEGNSAVFDGESLLVVKGLERLTEGEAGFTLTAWVNPYLLGDRQQMIAAKNRYSLGERQWGVMIDKDNRFRLYVWQGRWATVDSAAPPQPGRWHLIGVVVRPANAELWVNGILAGNVKLTKPIPQTKAPLTFGGVDDNGRIWQNFVGALDEIHLVDKPLDAEQMGESYKPVAATHKTPATPQPFTLWAGTPIPDDAESIPFVPGVEHRTIHRPSEDGYTFLHGAAIVEHKGVMYANWANSPKNENGEHETLQGRRSRDGGVTWSELEVIGPGFEGKERHSHGVLFVHKDELWAICARFGVGTPGRRFSGLQAEAFVLDEQTDRWKSRGVVMKNCWPYDEPVRMANGNFITGGQDKDGLPVVAISHGDDLARWDSVLIPYDRRLQPSFAETTVWSEGKRVIAVIRGGGGVAWVSTSDDYGRTWSKAGPSNLPMPRAKAYLGKLSTGQLYLLSNLKNRDTLCVSVSRPGEQSFSRMWRIRHGKSTPPRFPGSAKSKQWSYPYGYEHEGKLYVVYSIGKEDCGLSVIPLASLTAAELPAFKGPTPGVTREIDMPLVDLSVDTKRHSVVAAGTTSVYQGHCDTVLLPDGKTMFTAWCLGHARWIGPIARSTDAGRTWSEPLDVPDNWKETSNTPALHRLVAPDGKARLFCFADGLDWSRRGKPPYPMHQSYSEDAGKTWTPMAPNGVQGEVPPKTIHAFDHGKRLVMWSDLPGYVVQSESLDGGLTWSAGRRILRVPSRWSQPCVIRSADGKAHLMLLRENSRKYQSLFSVSHDGAKTWSEPKELPATLTGDRHVAKFAPDGRLVVAFRDVAKSSPTYGHYVAWVGRFEDIRNGKPGDYRIKLFHNSLRKESDKPGQGNTDCGYSDLEVLPDGTIIATTYIKVAEGPEKHSVMNTRFTLAETDAGNEK